MRCAWPRRERTSSPSTSVRPSASMNYPNASPEDLEQTVKEVEALDRTIIARKADVRLREQLQDVLDEGLARSGTST
jgi:hypothetical protein